MKKQKLPISSSTHRVTYSAGETPDEVIFDQLRRGHIPIIDSRTIKWMDNRVICPYARRNRPGWQNCQHLHPTKNCILGDGRPCVYDEPNDAEIWQRIRKQSELCGETAADPRQESR
ncbi:MAG: hypothetical protein KDJ97_22490 [Anaerolineae bacterium]|nr:hypothetical protein [Anaerolineae bacterium]